MGNNEVKYVDFGGVMVPETARKTTYHDRNTGKTMYCVFLDDNGSKVTYSKQIKREPEQMEYVKLQAGSIGFFNREFMVHESRISKTEFNDIWNKSRSSTACETLNANSVNSYLKGEKEYRHVETNTSLGPKWYFETPVDTTPRIDYSSEGILLDTKKVRLSNLNGAKYRGSDDEDEVTAQNCTKCTFDVSDENNNVLFSDSVKIVNGSGNKVISGDYDKTTFATLDYDTAKETVTQKHKGEGTFKQ